MKARTIIVCLVAALALGFYLGAVSGAFAVTQAEKPRDPPPAGDQFDEGPVLVRLPGASTNHIRYIF
ncbi:hypothetical protein NJI34_00105 [Pseudomonas sp. S 311-6]|uniref:hypothetical protein n=1 Tax=Pseudomonas TaxID=286 RepID=UPI002097D3FC|nr:MULTISPECIES: hypothetical protein [Pseudomonas]MCO7567794.1 hypothetical protein [Pseudomonas mosselii]MCO7619359.1 hypothetical protein [Pseudomonas guariconensis]MCO7635185.1 hypothetical protein [Pseudomonas sp. S 311-6]